MAAVQEDLGDMAARIANLTDAVADLTDRNRRLERVVVRQRRRIIGYRELNSGDAGASSATR
jgi:hypothetical protein